MICVEIGDGYEVQFDDGDRATLTAAQVRPLAVNSGNRVHCRWKGGNIYFPGAVVRSEGAAIHVDYDDGDKEITSISMMVTPGVTTDWG